MSERRPLSQGIDLVESDQIAGKKIILIANHTSVDKYGISVMERLREKGGVIKAILSLEHGFFPVAQDMEAVDEHRTVSGIPVISLYGDSVYSLQPAAGVFSGCDLVVYDVQDIGSRYYTYLQSLTLCMDILEQTGTPLLVLDRINPVSGSAVEGAILEEKYASFVGRFPLLHRHGFTSGECAGYYHALKKYTFPLDIVCVEGWRRDTYFDTYDYPWIPTSPNMPTLDTAILYPGGCLLEATSLSEGRGTTFPFHVAGSPRLSAWEMKEAFDCLGIQGLTAVPLEFRPMFQKDAGQRCGGLYFMISDRTVFSPVRSYLKILDMCRAFLGEQGFYRDQPYEFVSDIPAIDLLLGNAELIALWKNHASFAEIDTFLVSEEQKWRSIRRDFLLYD